MRQTDEEGEFVGNIPFWEKTYRDDNVMTFSAKPNKTIMEIEPLLNKNADILEVGCGEGQNVLYLAKNGFQNIDAFDISEAGVAKLKRLCKLSDVCINAFTCDLGKYRFDKSFDLIMSFATLCFVEKNIWKRFICEAKKNTKIGGIHIMHIFTDEVPASADIAVFAIGVAHNGEIKDLYDDWEIINFQSYIFEDEHPGIPKHLHSVNKISARKTK